MPGADARVAIVTALPEEARAIGRALAARAVPALGVERSSLVVAWTGDGAARARRNLALLLNRVEPTRLIGAGVAGALTEDLMRGAIARPSAASDETGRRIKLDGGDPGTLVVSANRPLFSPAEKRSLARKLDLEENAIVDLETYAWAEVAANRKTPISSVRAVLDAAADDLPEYLLDAVRSDGSMNRRAAALAAVVHPWRVRRLLRLRREFLEICETLAKAVAAGLRRPD